MTAKPTEAHTKHPPGSATGGKITFVTVTDQGCPKQHLLS